jgi:hypothetical protein
MRTHLMATTAAAALLAATSAQASREQPCRRPNGSRPFGLPLPKRPRLRAALNLAARIAIPVIVLNGVSGVASAQNAIWGATGATANWNTSTNWIPNNIPGATGLATFSGNPPTSIVIDGAVPGVQVGPFYSLRRAIASKSGRKGSICKSTASASTPVLQMRRRSPSSVHNFQPPRSISMALVPLARRSSFLAKQLIQITVSMRAL